MKNMAYTPEELKEEKAEYSGTNVDMPRYPYGLQLSLSDDMMKKLGLTSLPVGQDVMIMAKARITGQNSREKVDGTTGAVEVCTYAELQITDMEVGGAAKSAEETAAKLYTS